MEKVLAITTNFGLGPVSKLYSIIKEFGRVKLDASITFCGSGESLNFFKTEFRK